MSEYLVQGETLTALADEIRVLSGTEGTMGLDAMKSNVNTANSAVSAALSALVDKGVDVPDGSNVSGLAELIGMIEAGGGKIVTGTLTTDGALSGHYAISTLDFKPTFAAIIRNEQPSTKYTLMSSVISSEFPVKCTVAYNNSSTGYYVVDDGGFSSVRTGTIYLKSNTMALTFYNGSTTAFMDGTYFWIAVG